MERLQKQLDEGAAVTRLERNVPPVLAAFGEMPVDSFPAARLRTDFRETAAWLPQLRAGADGIVNTAFKLPDSLTAFRLSAVALTRAAEIGTARVAIKVSLPLSVQVFVPRFAVESDALELAALIHNNTSEPRECDAAWEVEGFEIVGTPASQHVSVPAGQSVRVPLKVLASHPGSAKVRFRAGAADAEERELEIAPIGRAREIALTGAFDKSHRLALPEGFVASDLRIGMTRGSAAQAMEGLAYLVDYPYGCVEQTMSRFLPAVVVKEAIQEGPATLPPEVAAKLPGAIAQGLARLYNFQHEDGGWGWWEKDATNRNMTVYVAYGLACCKLTGTAVDQTVLDRACAYLKKELDSGGLAVRETNFAHGGMALAGRDLEARARRVLALANAASAEELTMLIQARPVANMSFFERCNLALACKNTAGVAELGERLAASATPAPASAEELALQLNVQLDYGAPLKDCNLTAAALLAKRTGMHWQSTQVTSYAIEALARMLLRRAIRRRAVAEVRAHRGRGERTAWPHRSRQAQGFRLPRACGGRATFRPGCREHRDVRRWSRERQLRHHRDGYAASRQSRPDRRGDQAGAKLLDARRQAAGPPRAPG